MDIDPNELDFRLSVKTELLRDVDVAHPPVLSALSLLNRTAPAYAFYADRSSGTVSLQSTAYVHRAIGGWLPKFFGSLAILQPIEAEFRWELAAQMLGGEPARFRTGNLDGILAVERDVYVPAGQAESRWIGTGEFERVAETMGRSDHGFGMGDPSGLSLETPFGSDSALLRLLTGAPHPTLGSGLLAVLRFPFTVDPGDANELANSLNELEARSWRHVPLLGAWCAADDSIAHSGFIPNLLYQPGLVGNLVLWNSGRVRWLRQTLFPETDDLPMIEILKQRLTAPEQAPGGSETRH